MTAEQERPPRYMRFVFSPVWGLIAIRIRGRFYQLRAPWREPMFSERYGYNKTIKLGFGWRITIRDTAEDRG